MQLKLVLDDRLSFTVGRLHQSIGYYNTAYHHGALLQTVVERPTW